MFTNWIDAENVIFTIFRKQLVASAKSKGLNASLIRDAGRTQIAPGTYTVVGWDQVRKCFRNLFENDLLYW